MPGKVVTCNSLFLKVSTIKLSLMLLKTLILNINCSTCYPRFIGDSGFLEEFCTVYVLFSGKSFLLVFLLRPFGELQLCSCFSCVAAFV